MIYTYCIYHTSYPATPKNTQNRFGVSNSYQKKNKAKLKAMSNELSPYATLTRP